jgi:hypothetical protein
MEHGGGWRSGNTPSTSPSQGNNGGGAGSSKLMVAGGGGGASAVGGNWNYTNVGGMVVLVQLLQ